jgi:pyruvate dehydrogenase kinase 2/3/4
MQKLPYVVVTNPHMSDVYDLYSSAFEILHSVPPINTVAENDAFCETVRMTLEDHLTVIPSLGTAVIECRDSVSPGVIDNFMNAMLRSVIIPVKIMIR